jgi:uncharacterized protein (TIGR00255 family)
MIASMTGFAAASLNLGTASVSLDLRSVNQRYLELHFRLADECRALEPRLRDLLGKKLTRGKVECRIAIIPANVGNPVSAVSAAALQALAACQSQVLQALPGARGLSVGEALRWPGVMANSDLPADLDDTLLAAAGSLIDALAASRAREGEALKAHILARLATIEALVDEVKPLLPQLLAAHREKLAQRLADALGDPASERLAQELALFAQKVDIDEELSRLGTHVAEVRRTLDRGGVAGKRLDFLMQELHREANTLGSKSASVETSRLALELKVLIEQMREQVQNIE